MESGEKKENDAHVNLALEASYEITQLVEARPMGSRLAISDRQKIMRIVLESIRKAYPPCK